WADTFDRKLTDIFSVESEVAKAVADQLRVHLTGREEQVINAKPTDNPEAYDAYLRGLAYNLKTQTTPANSLGAQKYFREAVRLDPKFALAWALLSIVEARGYVTQTLQPTLVLREEVRQAAETAFTLQPNLGEAVLAKGFCHYACLKDYDTAVRYLEQARQFLPNSSRIPESLADDTQALEAQVYKAILERRPAQIIPRLKEIIAKPNPTLGFVNGELRFWLGWAQEVAGDHAAAYESWRQARKELEPFLKEQPDN